MRHPRDSERGSFHGANLELLIFVGIVGILMAIAFPLLAQRLNQKGRTCLEHLAREMAQPGAKAICPACDKPYALTSSKEGDSLSCAEPGEHLLSKPRFTRPASGAWTLEQTLPVYEGNEIDVNASAVEIQEKPGRTSVFVKPSFGTRWVLGILLGIFLGTLFVACAAGLVRAVLAKEWGMALGALVAVGILGSLLGFQLASAASSHQWVFEPGSARATRTEYLAGMLRSEKVYTGCLGVVPTGKTALRLELVHAPDADGARVTTIEEVPKDRLDIARWYHRAVTGK